MKKTEEEIRRLRTPRRSVIRSLENMFIKPSSPDGLWRRAGRSKYSTEIKLKAKELHVVPTLIIYRKTFFWSGTVNQRQYP
jgi:hypothetical protein